MHNLLYHGTKNLAGVLFSNTLKAFETDTGENAVCFSRDPRTARWFARGDQGGLLVFDRRALQSRVRLRLHHMNVYGFVLRQEDASECEERVLADVPRINTALVGWMDKNALDALPPHTRPAHYPFRARF